MKLERKGDGYEKVVELPQSEQKILYKVRNIFRSFLAVTISSSREGAHSRDERDSGYCWRPKCEASNVRVVEYCAVLYYLTRRLHLPPRAVQVLDWLDWLDWTLGG